jgi:hypothetical protein
MAVRMFSSVLLLGANCSDEVSCLVLYQYTRLLLFYMSSSDSTLGIFLLIIFFMDLLVASTIGSCQRKLSYLL